MSEIEKAKQALVDETGAALWENWFPLLDKLIEAVRADERRAIAEEARTIALGASSSVSA